MGGRGQLSPVRGRSAPPAPPVRPLTPPSRSQLPASPAPGAGFLASGRSVFHGKNHHAVPQRLRRPCSQQLHRGFQFSPSCQHFLSFFRNVANPEGRGALLLLVCVLVAVDAVLAGVCVSVQTLLSVCSSSRSVGPVQRRAV